MFAEARALWIAAGFLFIFSLVPGMPKIVLWPAVAILVYLGWRVSATDRVKLREKAEKALPSAEPGESPDERKKRELEDLLAIDQLELEIGYGLIPLVDSEQQGDLLERVNNIRRQIATEMGFIVPPMRIRDNIQLAPGAYVIKVKGSEVAQGELQIDRYLAMNPSDPDTHIDGIRTTEPAFGIQAFWIAPGDRARAEALGFTVVDASTVLATHLTEVIRGNAAELVDRQTAKSLLDSVKERFPAIVDDLVPSKMSVAQVHKVLQFLLRERVSIRNLQVICETLGDFAADVRDPEILTEFVRQTLARQLSAQHISPDCSLLVSTLDPTIEERIVGSLQQVPSGTIPVLDNNYSRRLMDNVGKQIERMLQAGSPPVFLVSPRVRPYFRKLVERTFMGVVVLSYSEVTRDVKLKTVGFVEAPNAS
jgi:flagellar biosynthesis protein FlhA